MQLFLGVCKALQEMHVYTGRGGGIGGGGGGGGGDTSGERMEMRVNGADENATTSKNGRNKGRETGADEDDETEQQRPLMGGQEASSSGVKSYAHRDIKPGKYPSSPPPPFLFSFFSFLTALYLFIGRGCVFDFI